MSRNFYKSEGVRAPHMQLQCDSNNCEGVPARHMQLQCNSNPSQYIKKGSHLHRVRSLNVDEPRYRLARLPVHRNIQYSLG